MLSKINKLIILFLIIFYQTPLFSKSFDQHQMHNYFSALVSLEKNKYQQSLKFFNSSKQLKESHISYIKKYIFSLVQSGKVSKAINEIKLMKNKKFADFFEAHLLLVIDSLKKKNYKKSTNYLKNLSENENEGTFEFIISRYLQQYIYLFNENTIKSNLDEGFGKLSLINRSLQSCYLEKSETENLFQSLVNYNTDENSRYLFFYANYLIDKKKYLKAKSLFKDTNVLNSTLLISQAKMWVDQENLNNFSQFFSCKDPSHIISELFFIISNLHSTENEIEKSNFYFNISNYLNPKFKFNLALLADNFYEKEEFSKAKKVLKKFDKKNNVYYWYGIKKNAQIINKEEGEDKSFKYILEKFNQIEKPSVKTVYEMANIIKSFKKYDLSIKYYTKVLSKLDSKSFIYADVLYRRGGSYERLGNKKESDKDLLKSLEINPNEPHVLNYLAYSWLERNYNIDEAMSMLKKAYSQRQNDPYIIDSIGWAYYLIGDYFEAEKLLRKAVQIMPLDPIVNDHYGDILWKLGRKTQANYFWKNVLTFEDTEEKMKKDIKYKLIKGPKNS